MNKRQIPDTTIGKIELREGGLLSAKREYLQVSYGKDFYFAICAAPFGTGFFISYWLLQQPDGCLSQFLEPYPFLSSLMAAIKPWTYYRVDSVTMFQTAVHTAIMEAVDEITLDKDIPRLTEGERKPVMREFFNKV